MRTVDDRPERLRLDVNPTWSGRSTVRGEATRQKILDAAEQLYGARGVDAVSLRAIRIAAGQRNTSALQFHFGDAAGLRAAIAGRHLPRVAEMQSALWDHIRRDGREPEPSDLVAALVGPYAEYLGRGASERAWVKIAAEASSRPERVVDEFHAHASAVSVEVGARLHAHLTGFLSADLAVQRIMDVAVAALHLCADRARAEERAIATRHALPIRLDEWTDNLIDMSTGAMFAATRRHAHRSSS